MKKKFRLLTVFILMMSVILNGCGRGSVSSSDNSASTNGVSADTVSDDVPLPVTVSGDTVIQASQALTTAAQTEVDALEKLIYDNYYSYEDFSFESLPTGMSGEVITGYQRDIFFANGTDITIFESNADVTGFIHDERVQKELDNGLSPDNPGYGAVAIWQDSAGTRYVYLSNMCQVFGGSYKDTICADVSISINSTEGAKTSPNLSFVFGGGLGSDVIGDVSISVNDALPMYLCGGGLNGSVYGNIEISYTGNSWSSEIIGGGLARAVDSDVKALVYGDITLDIKTHDSSNINIVCGGGFAESMVSYAACSDVFGSTTVNITSQNVYEVAGGGISYCSDDGLFASSNVLGNTSVSLNSMKLPFSNKGSSYQSGVLVGGGLTSGGIAMVEGDTYISITGVTYDYKSLGIIPGGVCTAVSMNSIAGVDGYIYITLDKPNKDYKVLYEPDYYVSDDESEDDSVSGNTASSSDDELDYDYDDIFYPDFIMKQFFGIARTDMVIDLNKLGIVPGESEIDLKKYAGLAAHVTYGANAEDSASCLAFISYDKENELYGLYIYDDSAESFSYVEEPDFSDTLFECINVSATENYFINTYFALAHGGTFFDSIKDFATAGINHCYEESEVSELSKNGTMCINYPVPSLTLIWMGEQQ